VKIAYMLKESLPYS